MPNIHFYDTDTGYIHYVSDILPKLECRVYDGVRTFEDALLDQRNAVQFIPNSYGNVSPEQLREHALKLFQEAVSVSNKGVTFMDRIMKNSPFRDNDAWLNQPEGRALFLSQRQERLKAWRDQRSSLTAGNAKGVGDGQHRHGSKQKGMKKR